MILDQLSVWTRYACLHSRFAQAFEFLSRPDLASLTPGRHVIDGDRLYVSIDHREGRTRDGARLEAHRRYIDIQYTIDGREEIGWSPLLSCIAPAGTFESERDIIFFDDRPTSWFEVPPGRFAIFFPEDAHAPLGGHGMLRKAIAKIEVDPGQ